MVVIFYREDCIYNIYIFSEGRLSAYQVEDATEVQTIIFLIV